MPGEQDHSDDGHWVHVSEGIFPELEAMGLSVTVPKPAPEKRGSPRKNPMPQRKNGADLLRRRLRTRL